MPVKTAPKKAVKTAKKAIPAIERAEQAIEQLALAHQKTEQAIERLTLGNERIQEAHQKTEQAIERLTLGNERIQEAHQKTEQAIERLTLGNERIQEAHQKTEQAIESLALENEKTRKAQQETEKGMKKLQKLIGDLGNRFGEFNEHTLVPDLVAKFKKYGFSFGKNSGRVRINDDAHDIHAELDAFLENGTEALAVEVKVHLDSSDVKEHIRRMEKLRSYAGLHNDKRKFYAAIAATVIHENVKTHALKQGFFIIEPAGESVKIIPPVSKAKFW